MALDWSLNRPADIVGNALQGYQAGQQIRTQRETRNALAAYDPSNPAATGNALIRAGDMQGGSALVGLGAQQKQATITAEQHRQELHRAAAASFGMAGLNIPADPPDPANPNAPPTYTARAAQLRQLIASNAGNWDAEALQTLTAAVNDPNARFDDATMTSLARLNGANPDEGAYTLTAAPGATSQRIGTGGRVIASVHSNPEPRYQQDGSGILRRTDSGAFNGNGDFPAAVGRATPGLSSAPATSAPASGAPGGSRGHAVTTPDWVAAAVAPLNPTPTELAYLGGTSAIEGSGSQHPANNGSSTGAFQFHPDTFAGIMPHGDLHNAHDQAQAALLLARQNERLFQRLGITPAGGDLYVAHQQGSGGTTALYSHPSMNAIEALTPVYVAQYGAQRGPAMARRAILGNGGTADMTSDQFIQHWTGRREFGDQTAQPGGYPDTPAPPPPPGQAAPPAQNGPPATLGSPRPPPAGPAQGHIPTSDEHRRWPQADFVLANGEPHYPPASAATGGGTPSLSPAAIEQLATQYILDPSVVRGVGIGQSGAANRTAIINLAAEIQAGTGTTGADAVVQHAGVRAAQATLTQQTRLRGNILAFSRTFDQNAETARRLAMSGGTAGSIPIFNRWVQAGRRATGDPQVVAFDAAVRTVASEYAKISEGNTGSGGSSVESRRAAEELINAAQTPAQFNAVIQTMTADNQHRIASLDQGINELRTSIRTGGRSDQAAPAGRPAPSSDVGANASGRTGQARTRPAAPAPGPSRTSTAQATQLPPQAARALTEGHNTTFGNGQTWTLRGGRPVRVR